MPSAPPPPTHGPAASPRPRRTPDPRRLGIVAALGVALAAFALGIASLLDDPAGAGQRDVAQPIIAGPVAGLDGSTTSTGPATSPGEIDLPPFAMVLERPLPEGLSEVAPERALARLERRVAERREPRRLVELAVGYQRAARTGDAERTLREALRLDPDYLPARIGLALNAGASGAPGLARAQRAMDALARSRPRSQLVHFNRAWTALYRRDAAVAFPALETTVRLDPDSYLGVVAERLLEAARRPVPRSGP
jgi:tetratricopeptide (TPR) repeat protein